MNIKDSVSGLELDFLTDIHRNAFFYFYYSVWSMTVIFQWIINVYRCLGIRVEN